MLDFLKSHPMDLAIRQAEVAGSKGEVPVGAVVAVEGVGVIAQAGNCMRGKNDPTAHAEMIAIRRAALFLGTDRLDSCSIYVTLEPCAMCTVAISLARIAYLYYGAYDLKKGGVHSHNVMGLDFCYHRPEVYEGIRREKSESLLRDFFSKLR